MHVTRDPTIHLSYCTNVHAGEDWTETYQKLQQYLPAVKKQVCPHGSFGVGLRLSAIAASELAEDQTLAEFKAWLHENGLYVFSLNGFPYGRFHGAPVKDSVYAPDWRTSARTAYTLKLIHILCRLLPDEVRGSISTLPASYKPWFHSDADLTLPQEQSAENLASVAMHLWAVEQTTGKLIRLGLEPEPDGLVEDTDEFIVYFERVLVPAAIRTAHQHGLNASEAERIARRYIGICFDTCHSSVQYEAPDAALSTLSSSGIAITKVQISAALKVIWQSDSNKQQIVRSLQDLSVPVYLHQVREKRADASILRYRDMPDALEKATIADGTEWRTHFHVPVFIPAYGTLLSTHSDTAECIRLCLAHDWCDHFEIETYTWDVLPPDLRTELVHSIAQEFDWTLRQINHR